MNNAQHSDPKSARTAFTPRKLEVVAIPGSDVARARNFYARLGWRLDADFSVGNDFRVVQFTPPGSPASIHFGTGVVSDETLTKLVREYFDLRPAAIIDTLDLRRPIYRQTAAYGHFGRPDLDLPWEATDKAEILKAAV